MEEITVQVMEPSGMKHSGRATLNPKTGVIYVSDAFVRSMSNLHIDEDHLWPTATIGTSTVPLLFRAGKEPRGTAMFVVDPVSGGNIVEGRRGIVTFLGVLDREQWQQFGRFSHTLCASALVGIAGYFHIVKFWDSNEVLQISVLAFAAVILFLVGILAVKGD